MGAHFTSMLNATYFFNNHLYHSHIYTVTWYFATHKDCLKKIFNFGNLEQRIMPEAVCDSQKSGVERNVLGRLLTLTYIFVLFFLL